IAPANERCQSPPRGRASISLRGAGPSSIKTVASGSRLNISPLAAICYPPPGAKFGSRRPLGTSRGSACGPPGQRSNFVISAHRCCAVCIDSGEKRPMSVYNAGDFRKGIKVIVEGQPFEMVHCDFVKPGKGQALYKTKLRNMLTGTLLDIT